MKKTDESIIEITEDTELVGTGVILEKGDRVQIVESTNYRQVENDTLVLLSKHIEGMGPMGPSRPAEYLNVIQFMLSIFTRDVSENLTNFSGSDLATAKKILATTLDKF